MMARHLLKYAPDAIRAIAGCERDTHTHTHIAQTEMKNEQVATSSIFIRYVTYIFVSFYR